MIILGILAGTAVAFMLTSIITGLDMEELIEKLVFIGLVLTSAKYVIALLIVYFIMSYFNLVPSFICP